MKIKKAVSRLFFLIVTASCNNSQNTFSSLLLDLDDSSRSGLAADGQPETPDAGDHPYLIGTGISDMTGPPAGSNSLAIAILNSSARVFSCGNGRGPLSSVTDGTTTASSSSPRTFRSCRAACMSK
jgi:hypothetical protein